MLKTVLKVPKGDPKTASAVMEATLDGRRDDLHIEAKTASSSDHSLKLDMDLRVRSL